MRSSPADDECVEYKDHTVAPASYFTEVATWVVGLCQNSEVPFLKPIIMRLAT